MRISKCKSCGAPIIFIETVGGKRMPCDAQEEYYIQRQAGTKKIITKNGEVLSCELTEVPEMATGLGYVPHWSTCTAPGRFRKEKN